MTLQLRKTPKELITGGCVPTISLKVGCRSFLEGRSAQYVSMPTISLAILVTCVSTGYSLWTTSLIKKSRAEHSIDPETLSQHTVPWDQYLLWAESNIWPMSSTWHFLFLNQIMRIHNTAIEKGRKNSSYRSIMQWGDMGVRVRVKSWKSQPCHYLLCD